MGKYTKLLKNTAVFAIGTFSSKILVFLLLPLYSRLLNPGDYGTVSLIVDTCNFIVPIISLSIHEAVIRFGLDSSIKKSDVLSTSIVVLLSGYVVLLACSPLLRMVSIISDYTLLICIYTVTSALRSTVSQFVRASGFVRLFALDGLITTAVTIALNLVFMVGLGMGVVGYVLATICADIFSTIFLILVKRLYQLISFGNITGATARAMLRYCIPLMPTAIFWWVTNLSDRYFISYMLGVDANGLYSMASKIPTMITLVSAIFTQAWQIAAFSDYDDKERAKFYSTVFQGYYIFIFLAASGIILLAKPLITIIAAASYYESWQYIPFLVLAVSFSCFVTFLGSVYNAAKKNLMVFLTTLLGAVLNIILNSLLIPGMGAQGAAIATFASFLVVFIIRAVDTRRYIAIEMHPVRLGAGLCLLLIQAVVALAEIPFWIPVEIIIFLLMAACNLRPILTMLRQVRLALAARFGNAKKA